MIQEDIQNLDLLHTLREIDLSAKEAGVYLTLLALGPSAASLLARHTELKRTTCYTILTNLMNKGFVTQTNDSTLSVYNSVEPKYVLKQLEVKKFDIEKKIFNLGQKLEKFEQMTYGTRTKPQAFFFEGDSSIQNVMEDTLNSSECLRAYANVKELVGILPNYFRTYYKRRTSRGIFCKSIYPACMESYLHKLKDGDEMRETRLVKPEFDFHLDILIYDNTVAITSLRERFGLLIRSKEMAKAQKKIFDIMWKFSKKQDEEMMVVMKRMADQGLFLNRRYWAD